MKIINNAQYESAVKRGVMLRVLFLTLKKDTKKQSSWVIKGLKAS